ncbi:MAG TPA: bifunctional hydroxymethylpyrimidine kinase/phosphomethylpyrimidine kinase [Steroidobacteraceae bacterium]|nr:bifunctional hydroxymethylpyrimidine kinase/phosphomethylpyrimidine kinase [Steroidobacteraceae bacterium]
MSGRPTVLVIAGSDSSGGAGIVRDLRTLADFGVEAVCAITAVTAQTHGQVASVHHVPPEAVRAQIRAALASSPVGAIKVGMLGTAATVRAVAESLPRAGTVPLVLDPVLVASSGSVLLDEEGRAQMRARLFPLTTLLTPNIPEAASLCGAPPAAGREALLAQARALLAAGPQAVLLKGGHAEGNEALDLLLPAGGPPRWLSAPRIDARCRGTGCALACAIAAGLASGKPVEDACREAKQYVLSMLADLRRGAIPL